ncbi:hypothetical protein EVAR_26036_1 [Eumeta japonica]|uniref:Uncharacterized protein n=1 Tax=Eumeta variegata TaxID=151549 RepID=A0A4C1VT22_EUMVA|nr:hypothetical protein EVAR_26036_1 [Eumeta japonica]
MFLSSGPGRASWTGEVVSDAGHALAVAADRVASARWAAAATAAPWTIPFLVAPTPEVLECHRAVSGLRLLEVATGVDEGEVEESEVKAKVEAVEAKAEAEAAVKVVQHHFHCRPRTITEFLHDQRNSRFIIIITIFFDLAVILNICKFFRTFIRPSDRRDIIEPLEVSDYEKRRTYAPASYMLDVPESAPQPASPAIFVPSPAAFVELEGHGNITSPSSIASPSISFRTSRPLNDDEIEEALMFDGKYAF